MGRHEMKFNNDKIPEEIEAEEEERRDAIVSQFQDLRNRIISVEREGVDVGAIKMKMLEAKSFIEDGKLIETNFIKDACEKMLIIRIKNRDVFDKLESGKQLLEKARNLGMDIKRHNMVFQQAGDLVEAGERETALEMIKIAVDELEGSHSLQEESFNHLLKVQKTITKATEVGMDTNKFRKKFIQMIRHVDGGDFSKAIRLSMHNLFKIQNDIWGIMAEEELSKIKGKLFKVQEEGLVIKDSDEVLQDLGDAFENNDFVTFNILGKYIKKAIEVNKRHHNKVERAYQRTGRRLRQLKDNGIWDELVLDIFEQGKQAFEEGDYAFADECIYYLEPDVKKMSKLAEKQGISLNKIDAEEILDSAKEILKVLENLEVNTRNFRLALRDAKELYSKGDYDLVINLLQPIKGQMEKCHEDALERLKSEVFVLLKKSNKNLSLLRDEGIDIKRFEQRMDDVQELIDDEEFRNAWALLDGVDDDIAPLIVDITSFNELLPKCRERFEMTEGDPGFDEVEDKYDAIFSLKKSGDLKAAIKKAGDFLADTKALQMESEEIHVIGVERTSQQPLFQDHTGHGYTGSYGVPQYAQTYDSAMNDQPPTSMKQGAGYQQFGIQSQAVSGKDASSEISHKGSGGYSEETYPQYDTGGYGEQYGTAGQSDPFIVGDEALSGGEQYYCNGCSSILQHIEEYDAWWCDHCQKYEGE